MNENDKEAKFPHLFGRQLYESELMIASHYLHHPGAPLRQSAVRPHHFACVPALGELWGRGLEMEAEGQKAELSAFVMDESCRQHFELIDRITDFAIRRGSDVTQIGRQEERVIEAATLRMLRGAVIDIQQSINEQEMGVEEVLSTFSTIAESARDQRPSLEIKSLDDAICELARDTIEAARAGKKTGLPMYLKAMQERLGGWRPGRLHVVVGITSGHKSTIVRASLEHLAEEGYPTLLISYEDPAADFAGRSVVATPGSHFTTTEIMNADFGLPSQRAHRLSQFISQIKKIRGRKIPMYIWDKPLLADELISLMYRATKQYKLKAIGIDFLQLIRSNDPRTQDVVHLDRLTNRLQIAAKELGVALIVAAQPTQGATFNATKNNIAIGVSDVKGAAAISQASFGLLALHFPMERVETESTHGGKKHTDVEYERIPNRIMIIPRKWKSGSVVGAMTFACDGAHDLISDIKSGGR